MTGLDGRRVYLDWNAGAPLRPEARAAMLAAMDPNANASSVHAEGRRARAILERARAQVADLAGCAPDQVIFTSGATESDNLAIKGAAHFYHKKGKHIITCKTEHKAVLVTCRQLEREGFEVTYLDPEPNGLIDLRKLEEALRDDTILVSVMHANNEIGTINDIAAIGEITRNAGVLFHVDAAQSDPMPRIVRAGIAYEAFRTAATELTLIYDYLDYFVDGDATVDGILVQMPLPGHMDETGPSTAARIASAFFVPKD
mgnify:CR=1 FL=1